MKLNNPKIFLAILVCLLAHSALHAQIFKKAPKIVEIKAITPVKKQKPNMEQKKTETVTPVKAQPEIVEEPAGVDVVVKVDGQEKTFRMARRYENNQFSFSEGMAIVYYEGKHGFVNEDFKELVPPKYKFAYDFNEGMAAVCNEQYKWTFINRSGKEITPFQFERATYFFDGLARVEINGKVKYIDKTGKDAFPALYANGGSFSEGLAWVMNNGKLAYIDQSGKEILTLPYCEAKAFQDGLAAVKKCKGEWGFINKSGEEVIPFRFMEIEKNFDKGQARVVLPYDTVKVSNSSYYLKADIIVIDKAGNLIRKEGHTQTSTKQY